MTTTLCYLIAWAPPPPYLVTIVTFTLCSICYFLDYLNFPLKEDIIYEQPLYFYFDINFGWTINGHGKNSYPGQAKNFTLGVVIFAWAPPSMSKFSLHILCNWNHTWAWQLNLTPYKPNGATNQKTKATLWSQTFNFAHGGTFFMQNSDVLIIFQEFFSSYQFLLLLKCVSAAYAISSASERVRTRALASSFLLFSQQTHWETCKMHSARMTRICVWDLFNWWCN